MDYICETLFRLKELLEMSLNLNDTKLRNLIDNIVRDMSKAVKPVDCLDNIDNLDIKKEEFNYII